MAGNTISDAYDVLPTVKAGRWLDARSIYGIFKAALPPNSPSCVNAAPNPSNEDNELVQANVISASSFHTGGVNACMADGAVRFVSDSVDAGDTTRKLGEALDDGSHSGYIGSHPEGHRWMGPSTYGVWGALATPAHGESKSL